MPLCLPHVGIGAGQADAERRELRVARPHLLARHETTAVDLARHACAAPRGRCRPPAPRTAGTRSRVHRGSTRSQRCFCSSVPCASSVGPARLMPTRFTGCGARDRAYSMLKIATCTGGAPRPPYSCGQWMPTHRSAASCACHARPQATSCVDRRETRGRLDVGCEPCAHLVGERLLLGRERQIHDYRSQKRMRS